MMKTCTKCKARKHKDGFHNDRSREDGRFPWCLKCCKVGKAHYYAANKDRIRAVWKAAHPRLTPEENRQRRVTKVCRCGHSKEPGQRCKVCRDAYMKAWRLKKAQHRKEYRAASYLKNRARERKLNKRWLQENKLQRREYTRQHKKERLATDVGFRMRYSIASQVRDAIKKRKTLKRGSFWKTIEYSLADLQVHLESQFRRGMTWDNYGKWEIDHIRPVSSYAFSSIRDKAFRECWALSNLQPLWKSENRRKSARWDGALA